MESDASIKINGKKVKTSLIAGQYVRIQRTWSNDDVIELNVPMHLNLRTWQVNKNSVSIDYGTDLLAKDTRKIH